MSNIYGCTVTDTGALTATTTTQPIISWDVASDMADSYALSVAPHIYPTPLNNIKKGDDNMRYLYEVILVNPKNDTFFVNQVIARSETSALMDVYNDSVFKDTVPFDDLKTSCKILMSWEKEKSLTKAIETIKKAVE